MQGPVGPPGLISPQGIRGPQGERGMKGDRGPAGEPGASCSCPLSTTTTDRSTGQQSLYEHL